LSLDRYFNSGSDTSSGVAVWYIVQVASRKCSLRTSDRTSLSLFFFSADDVGRSFSVIFFLLFFWLATRWMLTVVLEACPALSLWECWRNGLGGGREKGGNL